jgi:hypothetical protein
MPRPDGTDAQEPAAREPLVYGILYDNLILLPESVAHVVRDDLRAILALQTYGEARRLFTMRVSVPGIDEEDEGVESSPRDSEPYNAFDTAEYQNSDWPAPAATIALDEWPLDVEDLDGIGEEVEYFPSFPRLQIDPAREAELVAKARERGFVIYRDDELIDEIGMGLG